MSEKIYPYLRYRDPRAAIDWLTKAFGFEPNAVYDDEEGRVVHAQISLGEGFVMLGPPAESRREQSPLDLPGVSGGIYVYVEDVKTHYARARAAGAEITIELGDPGYGSLEYSALDLEGQHWSFGTYLPGPPGAE